MTWEAPSPRFRQKQRYEDCRRTGKTKVWAGDRAGLSEIKSSEPSGHHGVAAAAAKITPLRSSRNRNTEDVIRKKQTFMLFTTSGVKRA